MKKIQIIILAACLAALNCESITAAPVSPGRALEIGRAILEGPATRGVASKTSIVWDGMFEGEPATATPAFYVIAKDGGGFVIVSANDNARPVLAFSETGRFETKDMPDNVRWWMERMKSYVRAQVFPDGRTLAQWAALADTRANGAIDGTITDKVEHLTPEWNQGNTDSYYFGQQVFNKYCPQSSAGLTITGCVATAVGELLTTLSGLYPDDMSVKGQGTVGGYTASSGHVAPPAYELTTSYDWAGLRTLTDSDAIRQAIQDGKTELLDNLGHLLADCGAIAKASYSVSGTSAATGSNIVQGFAEHLYTSKTAHTESESNYTPARWKRMLKEELQKHPLLYSGQSPSSGGHAFLFDGYGHFEGDDVFHINFGWSGFCNGYYFYDNLDTGDGYIYSDHGMLAILDFYPDARQQTSYPVIIRYRAVQFTDGSSCLGISSLGDIVPGEYSRFRIGGIQNGGSTDYIGTFQFWQEDKDGNKIGDVLFETSRSEEKPLSPGYYFYYTSVGLRPSRAEFGDRIVGYYSTDASATAWEKIQVDRNGSIVGEFPLVPAAFIKTESTYQRGDFMPLQIMNYDQPYAGTVWTITAPDGTESTVPQSEVEFQLTMAGKYRIKAAIAPSDGADVVENVVTYITVR